MRVIVYEDLRGEWRWRFVASNGRIIADGAEGYDSRRNAEDGVERVIEGAHQIAITS